MCDIPALVRERVILDLCRDKLDGAHQLYSSKLEMPEDANTASAGLTMVQMVQLLQAPHIEGAPDIKFLKVGLFGLHIVLIVVKVIYS